MTFHHQPVTWQSKGQVLSGLVDRIVAGSNDLGGRRLPAAQNEHHDHLTMSALQRLSPFVLQLGENEDDANLHATTTASIFLVHSESHFCTESGAQQAPTGCLCASSATLAIARYGLTLAARLDSTIRSTSSQCGARGHGRWRPIGRRRPIDRGGGQNCERLPEQSGGLER